MATVNITLSPTGANPDSASATRATPSFGALQATNTITQITFDNPGVFKDNPAQLVV